MSKTSGKEQIVKDSLFKFLMQHVPCAQISTIDEIILSYVVSVLEELGENHNGDLESAFDAEAFCEMMAAYVPEFSGISLPKVCQWFFELEATLRDSNGNKNIIKDLAALMRPLEVIRSRNPSNSSECSSNSNNSAANNGEIPPRKHRLSEGSDASCTSDSSGEYYAHEDMIDYEPGISILQEMFPGLCDIEIRHCLTIADGDVTTAIPLILHRQETGQTLTHSAIIQHGAQQKSTVDDKEIKSRIIARYSFVDKDDDVREHRPVAPKTEPKKLVRYRDNKIVSMKGERFTEIKKEDEEESRKPSGAWNKSPRFH